VTSEAEEDWGRLFERRKSQARPVGTKLPTMGKEHPREEIVVALKTWVDRPPELVAVAGASCADKTARRRLRLRFPADFRFLTLI
jgi:hypothetical protein